MSLQDRLYFKLGSFRNFNLCSYDIFSNPGISLVALLWIASITIESFLYRGLQTVLQYSNPGLMIDLNSNGRVSLSKYVKEALMSPSQGWHIGGILPITDMPILICHHRYIGLIDIYS